MTSTYYFVVKPIDGKRYDSESNGFIFSSSIEDHKSTQRQAEVISLPYNYKGNVSVGDIVIVHHNIFRQYYNMKGKKVNGKAYVTDDLYIVQPDELYLKKSNGSDWEAVDDYIFIEPSSGLYGTVKYSNKYTKNTKVFFQPESEYEFRIDNQVLYRMFERNIIWTTV